MSWEDSRLGRKVVADGQIVELWRMAFNDRISITSPENDGMTHDDVWCFKDRGQARQVFESWDGQGEPPGWNKHPLTGRWREDGTPESEYDTRRPPPRRGLP